MPETCQWCKLMFHVCECDPLWKQRAADAVAARDQQWKAAVQEKRRIHTGSFDSGWNAALDAVIAEMDKNPIQ